MLNRQMDQEQLEKIIVANVRDNVNEFLKEKLLDEIKPFTQGVKNTLIINADSESLNFNQEDEKFGYILIRIDTSEIEEIVKNFEKVDFSIKHHVLFIANSINIKKQIEDGIITKIKTKLKEKNSRNKVNITRSEFECAFYNPNSHKNYIIGIKQRSDSLQNFNPKGVKGYIFTAKLKDIVELYNQIGDSLFDYNVRYKIKDELNVDSEIRKTLEKYPDMFWFYNNGITIVIKDPDFRLEAPDQIVLSNKKDKIISVINGAQTITTAANYFCNNQNSETNEIALVLLRIINIVEEKQFSDYVNSISIALNRQKSISTPDIAFTFDFVENLNNICYELDSDDNVAFELCKRGGTHYFKYSYSLVDFTKLVKCYLDQKPGIARNASIRLLKSYYDEENNSYVFSDGSIYKNIKNYDDFKKYYSPTNFASEIKSLFQEIADKINRETEIEDDICKYGVWYFVAKTIFVLNGGDNSDFTFFDCRLDNINKKDQKKMVETFVEEFAEITDKERLDSNDFKSDIIYESIKSISKMPKYEEFLTNKFQIDPSNN